MNNLGIQYKINELKRKYEVLEQSEDNIVNKYYQKSIGYNINNKDYKIDYEYVEYKEWYKTENYFVWYEEIEKNTYRWQIKRKWIIKNWCIVYTQIEYKDNFVHKIILVEKL